MDAYNVFNNLNFNPRIESRTTLAHSNFGTITSALVRPRCHARSSVQLLVLNSRGVLVIEHAIFFASHRGIITSSHQRSSAARHLA